MIRKKKPCKQCGEMFLPFNYLTPVCSPKCAVAFNSKKEVDKRVKQMRKEVQSLNELKAIARSVFQKYIRMRDQKLPCISCDKTEAKQWDGSHFFKAEIFTGLIFDEDNCNKSCSHCNQYLDGNLIIYRKGLIKKIGEQRVLELEEKANASRLYKFTKEELREIAQVYKSKIKDLSARQNVSGTIYDVKLNGTD